MFKLIIIFIFTLFPATIAFADQDPIAFADQDSRCLDGYIVYISSPFGPSQQVYLGISPNLFYSGDAADTKMIPMNKSITFDSSLGKILVTYAINAMNMAQHVAVYPATPNTCSQGYGLIVAYVDN